MKHLSLGERLKVYSYILFVPVVLICLFLLAFMANLTSRYDEIINNISAANQYNLAFKEDVDYAMYRIVIGSADPSDLDHNRGLKNPYRVINDTREVFTNLSRVTSVGADHTRLQKVMGSLDTLEDRIDEIITNVKEGGHYDDNIYKLDTNIYICTDLVQDRIQEYIYYEAHSLSLLQQKLNTQFRLFLLACGTLFVILWILTWFISRKLTESIAKPISQLCRQTELVAKGDFSTRAAYGSIDEIEHLAESFNRMVGEVGTLVDDVKTEQKNLRATELKLLQAQINPHFLYNTLDAIVWLAEDGQNEKVVELVSSLSDFFRGTLSKGRDLITLYDERQHILSYLDIQRFRYADLLEYEVDIPEELWHCQLLKLTLQPIVENALYHGVKYKRTKGMIRVFAEHSGDRLILKVTDNGIGMNEEKLEQVRELIRGTVKQSESTPGTGGERSGSGFGLSNVAERIRLNYGAEYGVGIKSEYSVGTVVTLTLPYVVQPAPKAQN